MDKNSQYISWMYNMWNWIYKRKLLHLLLNLWIAAIQCRDILDQRNCCVSHSPEICYWLLLSLCPFLQHVPLSVLSRNNNALVFYWGEWRSVRLEIPHCQCYEPLKIQYWSLMQSPDSNNLPLSSAILAAPMGRWNLRGQEVAFLKKQSKTMFP